jgi:hypothetical protein
MFDCEMEICLHLLPEAAATQDLNFDISSHISCDSNQPHAPLTRTLAVRHLKVLDGVPGVPRSVHSRVHFHMISLVISPMERSKCVRACPPGNRPHNAQGVGSDVGTGPANRSQVYLWGVCRPSQPHRSCSCGVSPWDLTLCLHAFSMLEPRLQRKRIYL